MIRVLDILHTVMVRFFFFYTVVASNPRQDLCPVVSAPGESESLFITVSVGGTACHHK